MSSGFTEPLNPCTITLKVYGIDDLAKISGSLENMQILRHKQRIHKYQWLQAVSMACDSMGMRALIIAKLVISSKKWHHLLCSFRIVFWKPPFTGHWFHRILPVPHCRAIWTRKRPLPGVGTPRRTKNYRDPQRPDWTEDSRRKRGDVLTIDKRVWSS